MHLRSAPLSLPALLLLPAGLGACSDYNLDNVDKAGEGDEILDTGEGDTDPDPGEPDLQAEPGGVDLGILCGEGSDTITLSNAGDGLLTISDIVLTGGGAWTLEGPTPPLELEPGDSTELLVTGSDGTGKLEISSDDPDTPLLSIPLVVSADAAPTVQITAPADGETLAVGALTTFEAQVSDDADAVNELSVSWTSDVDGVVSTEAPDGDGLSSWSWDAAAVSSGSHTVTVTVTDTCGNTASDTLTVCQNEGYVEDSVDIASWNFEGSATWDSANTWVQLTNTGQDQSGTAFQTSATVDADNVSIEFQFYVSGGSGADGISLTALDVARMTSFVGYAGGGIGYGGLPGWSVEVDTYHNSHDPTTSDHISVHIDGDYSNPVVWTTLPEMEDGGWHDMAVTVSGTWMTVSIDGTTYIDQDVSGLSTFAAYVGFTGATGSLTNYHLIDALEVEKFVCED